MQHYSTHGRPRLVTEAAIAAAVHWRESRMTMKQLADELDVSIAAIQAAIARHERGAGPQTRGRKRHLVGDKLDRVIAWHRSRLTFRELAARVGAKPGTLTQAVRKRAHFKQPPPEIRAAVIAQERARRAAISW